MATEVDGGNDLAAGCVDRYGHGAKANFVFLIADCVAVAANIAQEHTEFFYGIDRARCERLQDDARQITLHFIWRL